MMAALVYDLSPHCRTRKRPPTGGLGQMGVSVTAGVTTAAARSLRHVAEQLLAFDGVLPGRGNGRIPLGHIGEGFLIGGAGRNTVEFGGVQFVGHCLSPAVERDHPLASCGRRITCRGSFCLCLLSRSKTVVFLVRGWSFGCL